MSDFTGVVPSGGVEVYWPQGACSITIPHHRLECTLSAGGGRGLTWQPIVAGQSAVSPTTAYAIPSITSVTLVQGPNSVTALGGASTTGSALANCDGGDSVLLIGLNFGPAALIQQVRYGKTGVEYSARNWTWLNDSAILATLAPGIGKVCMG